MAKTHRVVSAGASLREWRIALGLSQLDVALRLCISPNVVSDLERDRRRPGIDLAFEIEDLTSLDARIWTKPKEREVTP